MALSGYADIPDEWKEYFDKLIQWNNRYYNAGPKKKIGIIPEKKKNDVPSRSLLPQISELWRGLSESEQNFWKSAGSQTNYNGWNLFVQDTSYRLKYGHEGLATPSDYHQYKVGRLQIDAPADTLVIQQEHPAEWWKKVKIRGSKSLYEAVPIYEQLMLPLTIGISYRSELTAINDNPIAKFYAKIISSYQGQDIETEVGFNLNLAQSWTRQTETSTEVLGVARWYTLLIELRNVRGFIEFDNLESRHTGTNYGRDIRCTNIDAAFSKIYFQVAKAWELIEGNSYTDYDSVYPDDE